ncbi:MAG: glutathione synthase [alpha proteobacterium HIMB59]|nr:MAG: glutathione synthase [alpha proteobacterium HIMB59]
MKFLFQMDDPKKINISEDSTYMIIKESLNRGIECFYNDPNWVYADINRKNKIKSHIFRIFLKDNGTLTYDIKNKINVDLENFSAIFIRQDPPYDMKYISNTYLLEKLKKPMVINNPSELRNFPEKHIMMNFPDLTPSTIISSDVEVLIKFIEKNNEVILKPAYGNGGLGIVKVDASKRNLTNFLSKYINQFSNNPIIAQRFLKNYIRGDKRVILINGNVKGSVLRVPKKNSIKSNFHAGGSAVKTSLNKKEKLICQKIKNFLINKKLYFVGIDIIDGFLTEINITSPTGIQEINRLDGVNIEKSIINFVLKSLK